MMPKFVPSRSIKKESEFHYYFTGPKLVRCNHNNKE